MNMNLQNRLEQLEERAQQRFERMTSSILDASFAALNRKDMDTIGEFFERYAPFEKVSLDEALATCTSEEMAAIERCNAATEAAALRINGRPLSKSEANRVLVRPGSLRDPTFA